VVDILPSNPHFRFVALDLSALELDARQAWLAFVALACKTVGVVEQIGSFAGPPPDSRTKFAYLTGSEALTRKLLLAFPQIYIQPREPPARVDRHFFYKGLFADAAGRMGLSLQPATNTVTLISSVFRSDEYLEGFLRNIATLQGYRDCQHLLIRAASPGDEHARLVEHVRAHAGAVYLNLEEDPGLYQVWNLGVRLSTTRYLSSANLDDRRAPEHLAHLQGILNSMPDVDVASTALRISCQKNLSWADSSDCPVWFADVSDHVYTANELLRNQAGGLAARNLPHCMPVWRRRLHAQVGEFDEGRYGPSADWAFWLHAGCYGTRFYFSNPPLGLYLRDDGSYWRKEPANRRFDQRILADFAHLAGSGAALSTKHLERPLSQQISAAVSLLQSGACFAGAARLLNAAAEIPDGSRLEKARELLDEVALRFLGCEDFPNIVARFVQARTCRSFHEAAFDALTDMVHQFDPRRLDRYAAPARRCLELACTDLCECSEDLRGLLLLALLARQHGELAAEQALLRHAHDADSGSFWAAVQTVYRFVRPLHELCGAVSPMMLADHLQQPLSSHSVVFYPDYGKSNAYQDLLYRPLREAGGRVYGTSDEDELLSIAPLQGYRNVLHVHWVNRLFKPDDSACRYQTIPRAEAFLAGLARQKQRGFALYWTIHNRLSHESCDPAAERDFRQALYRLADRVFIHHPLVRSLLDWLPDDHKLCLCEHGNYGIDVASELPRCAARQSLGVRPDDFVVTHLGQIRDYKALNHHLPVLFDQLARFPQMRLLIAGRVDSPGARRWLQENRHSRATVRDAFLSDDELTRYMRATDVGFLSYGATLTSGTLFHWLTCGCPVLAPASGTIPAYVLDGWNGLTYRDPKSLGRLLASLMTLPKEELARLARNAQTTAARLSWRMWNGDAGC